MILNKKELILSYTIKLIAIIITLVLLNVNQNYFVAASLVFMINSLIRLRFLTEKLYIISLIVEIFLASFLYINYNGILYMLYFTIVIDTISLKKFDMYLPSFLNLLAMIYLVKNQNIEFIVFLTSIYIAVLIFIVQMSNMKDKLNEVEYLYDDIRRYSYELEGARNRLLEYSGKIENMAQLEERDRISREIHDSIGHNLTGLYMQSELAIKIMEINKNEGMEILRSIRDNLHDSIEIMRTTVKKLKYKNYYQGIDAISEMVDSFQKRTGVNINYCTSGKVYKIEPDAQQVLYRNIQEAMTNSIRHGEAKNIWINLSYCEESVTMSIKDDGKGCRDIKKGMGISSMDDRVKLLGGVIRYKDDKGFEITTILPKKERILNGYKSTDS